MFSEMFSTKNNTHVHNMEGESHAVVEVSASGGATPANSRWNPTKEQIEMLEGLYKQGIRTPNAEQIQQITTRLKAFGHIEGKNVFYWFQNHKARQRQKQKQDSMAYFNRYHLHKAPTLFPPPCPNVVCSPYFLTQNDLGFYPQPKVLLPGGIKRRSPRPDDNILTCGGGGGGGGYKSAHLGYNNTTTKKETLPLFPLEPTGILQARTASSSVSTTPSSSSDTTGIDQGFGDQQPFFDFFAGNGSCESD